MKNGWILCMMREIHCGVIDHIYGGKHLDAEELDDWSMGDRTMQVEAIIDEGSY